MCSLCRMAPAEVERQYRRQGAVDENDFEEVNYHPKKKDKPPRVRGCPGNDHKEHVYIWTTELEPTGWYTVSWSEDIKPTFHERHGFYRQEARVCVGCGRVSKRRYTEEFSKLVSKKGWYQANYGWRRWGPERLGR